MPCIVRDGPKGYRYPKELFGVSLSTHEASPRLTSHSKGTGDKKDIDRVLVLLDESVALVEASRRAPLQDV